jgi:HTH-type transcriptional regulator / antitoxin HigA
MAIRALNTEMDYRAALAEVARLVDFDPAPSSPEGDTLDVLSALVELYEQEHISFAGATRDARALT